MTKDKTAAMIFRNRIIDKGHLKNLIAWSFTHYGTARTAQMADRLKDLGFRYATKAGVSISVDDLQVPPSKAELLEAAESRIRSTESQYARGEITEVERFQRVIDTWNSTSEALKDEVVRYFRATDPLNSVYMMAFSGARGNISQVRQLVGMRGLMANPQGEIIDLPIKTNFREGLTVTEYIISSYGARKGLVDTALRTADSGYLTRRLVDVSQDVIVRETDCGTTRGIELSAMTDGEQIQIPLATRLMGRMTAAPVLHPTTGEVIVDQNQPLSEELAKEITRAGVKTVMVRSPLTCEATRSVCQACYGWSLAHSKMVDLGEAVGIIAAQSIGEPGTQLTMRTFHTGGVFSGSARLVLSPTAGTISLSNLKTRKVPQGLAVSVGGKLKLIVDAKANADAITGAANSTPVLAEASYHWISIPTDSILLVKDGEKVRAGQMLAQVPTKTDRSRATERATKDVATDLSGEVLYVDIIEEEKRDRQGNTTRIARTGGLVWILAGEVYNLPPTSEPVVKNGQVVQAGDVLLQTSTRTERGGTVRLNLDAEALASGALPREVEIITAQICLDQARVIANNDRPGSGATVQYTIVTDRGEQFALLCAPGTKVVNNQVVAELIDDSYRTATGGILKYAGVEVKRAKGKQGYEVTKGGQLLWIPEECHEVNKDISLLLVEDGSYVEAGTEVVKDIFTTSSGVVEVTQKNDILREITVKPGDLYLIESPDWEIPAPGSLLIPGTEVLGGVSFPDLRYVEHLDAPEGPAVLFRSVIEFEVPDEPCVPSQENTCSGRQGESVPIRLRSVMRLPYKDGDRIKSVEGLEILKTQLVLEIGSAVSRGDGQGANEALSTERSPNVPTAQAQVSADIELVAAEDDPEELRLSLVILESLSIRKDSGNPDTPGLGIGKTRLLVTDGQVIAPGAVVAQLEILCKEGGTVQGVRDAKELTQRRILVVRDQDLVKISVPVAEVNVKAGDCCVGGLTPLAENFLSPESGVVVNVDRANQEVTLRLGRPYRVSAGAILHYRDGDLVQRGDNLVLLVFERSKTGDIIQGLPRIEELLEGRKPKEACVLAMRSGTVQVTGTAAEDTQELRVIEHDGTVTSYDLPHGGAMIVTDGQRVEAGQALSDGPANPHAMLELFFNLYKETMPLHEAALSALAKVQWTLVNEVQSVYQSQGIDISDKHIEVIVRQMTSKARIEDGGDTTLLPGELVELYQIGQVNEAMSITGGAPAQYTPVLLGITKASLNTDSFISAASFQETTRVLTEAAIEGKSDWLRGLKENVIIGRLIPAGTGFNAYEEVSKAGALDDSELTMADYGDDPDELQDVVLDDRTARSWMPDSRAAWNLEENASYGADGLMGYPAMGRTGDLDEDELIDDGVDEDDF